MTVKAPLDGDAPMPVYQRTGSDLGFSLDAVASTMGFKAIQ